MRIILIILGSLVALVAAVALWGWMLPEGHMTTRVLRLSRPATEVWAAITDFEGQAALAPTSSPSREARAATETWKEVGSNGEMLLATTEMDPHDALVRTIADPSLPFGGKWVYDVAPDGAEASPSRRTARSTTRSSASSPATS
jgi:hypothetical protein